MFHNFEVRLAYSGIWVLFLTNSMILSKVGQMWYHDHRVPGRENGQ